MVGVCWWVGAGGRATGGRIGRWQVLGAQGRGVMREGVVRERGERRGDEAEWCMHSCMRCMQNCVLGDV
eukprot:147863-Pleurochrysis_carterae.AAC.1